MTKEKRKQLLEVVKKHWPTFDPATMFNGFQDNPEVWNRDSESTVYFANDMEQMASCCGILELSGLRLHELTSWKVALFTLWVNQTLPARNHYTAMVATTASGPSCRTWSKTEKALLAAGFKPVVRGRNRNTGNNCTLWVFQFGEDKMLPLPTED